MTKTALITGASSDIGMATARALAAKGWNLVLLARREDRLHALADELNHVDVSIHAVDVNNRAVLEQALSEACKHGIDAVINNAGLSRGKQRLHEYDPADIDIMIQTNISAATHVARLTLPALVQSKGTLVNVSSIAARQAYFGGAVYCGTKAYMALFSRALRHDYLGTGVRIVDVSPGAVETEFSNVRFNDEAKADAVYAGWQALKATDIADAIVYALEAPAHVNIDELCIHARDQASPTANAANTNYE